MVSHESISLNGFGDEKKRDALQAYGDERLYDKRMLAIMLAARLCVVYHATRVA